MCVSGLLCAACWSEGANSLLLLIFSELCDFGTDTDLVMCEWTNRNGTALKWDLGAGTLANWLGGPIKDASGTEDAEKGFFLLGHSTAFHLPLFFQITPKSRAINDKKS